MLCGLRGIGSQCLRRFQVGEHCGAVHDPAGPDVARSDRQSSAEALTRTLRLTGAVAYNGFNTIPVISQISGPVSRIVVVPGQHVIKRAIRCSFSSPDLFAAPHELSEVEGPLRACRKRRTHAPKIYTTTKQSLSKLEQAQSAEVQAGGDLVSALAA